MIILFYFPELLNSSCLRLLPPVFGSQPRIPLSALGLAYSFCPWRIRRTGFHRRFSLLTTMPGHTAFFVSPVLSFVLVDLTFPFMSGLRTQWSFFLFLCSLVSTVGATSMCFPYPPLSFWFWANWIVHQSHMYHLVVEGVPCSLHTWAGQFQESCVQGLLQPVSAGLLPGFFIII